MKRFTQKFFLLAIGMILSVGAYAQETVTHAYPAVTFTVVTTGIPQTGKTFTVPAWDGYVNNPSAAGRLRIQKKELIKGKQYYAKLVTRYGIGEGNTLWVPELNSNTPIMVTVEGVEGEFNLRDLTYEMVVPVEERDANYGYTPKVLETNQTYAATGNYHALVGDENGNYTIATTSTHKNSGQEFVIDEIGDWAFRQFNRSTGEPTYNWLRANTVTIPAGIKKIGRGSFYHIGHVKKYVFEEGSLAETTTIPEFNFTDNKELEEVVFPSNIIALTGTVLGGATKLNKITFTGENPPALNSFTWNNKTYKVFESTLSSPGNPTPSKCIIEVPLHAAKTYVDSNDKFKEFPMSSEISFIQNNKELEMITYCSDLEFTLKQFDNSTSTPWKDDAVMKAYYVESNKVDVPNANIELTQITETAKIPTVIDYEDDGTEEGSPRYFGVILTGDPGQTYKIFYPNNLLSNVLQSEDNCLKGVNEDTPINIVENYLYFVISNGKFHPVRSSGTLGAHKAYVKYGGDITGGYGARDFSISFPGEATGIMNAEVKSAQNDAWYTMQGIQVQQPSKGVFIKNGKKFVIK